LEAFLLLATIEDVTVASWNSPYHRITFLYGKKRWLQL